MILKIVRLTPDAIIPNYAHPSDSGLDLYSVEDLKLNHGSIGWVRTGISIELPPGAEAQIRPRSGLAIKNGITVLNAPGTVDEGYRGEICVILINHGTYFEVTKGMKIAQMVIAPVIRVEVTEVEYLSNGDRGLNGFGSTGK